MDSFENLEYFLESILIVVLSHTLTSDSGKSHPSQLRFEYVNSVIKGMPNDKIHDDNDNEIEQAENKKIEEDKYEENFQEQRPEAWVKWSTNIYEQASSIAAQCVSGETLNAYYKEVAENIKRLMYYLLLWAGIMIPFFGIRNRVATSSSIEAEFANIKTRAFRNELPQRADKFILRHVDYLDGHVKEASAKSTFSKIAPIREEIKTFLEKPVKQKVEISGISINTDLLQSNFVGPLSSKDICNDIQDGVENVDLLEEIDKAINAKSSEDAKKFDCSNVEHNRMENLDIMIEEDITREKATEHKNLEKDVNEIDCNYIHDASIEQADKNIEKSMKIDSAIKYEQIGNILEKDAIKSELESYNHLNVNENWGGKITPNKRIKRPTYMDPFPDWDFVQSDRFVSIPILSY